MKNTAGGMYSKSCCTPQDANLQGMQMDHCPCIPQETTIQCVQLAASYVPFQKFCGNWPPLGSLMAGTIFAELFSPYCKREYVNLEPEITCQMCPAGGGRY